MRHGAASPGAVIRVADEEDAPDLERLYRQLVSNPALSVSPDQVRCLAEDTRTALFVAECEGRLAGTALVCLCADAMFESQPFAVVENVVVDEAFRGRGLGRALLQAVERYCLEADCSKIMLVSAASRTEAHRFFEACGFSGGLKRAFVKYRSGFTPPAASAP